MEKALQARCATRLQHDRAPNLSADRDVQNGNSLWSGAGARRSAFPAQNSALLASAQHNHARHFTNTRSNLAPAGRRRCWLTVCHPPCDHTQMAARRHAVNASSKCDRKTISQSVRNVAKHASTVRSKLCAPYHRWQTTVPQTSQREKKELSYKPEMQFNYPELQNTWSGVSDGALSFSHSARAEALLTPKMRDFSANARIVQKRNLTQREHTGE